MSIFEQHFPNANISEPEMVLDLQAIGNYFEAMGFTCSILETTELVPLPLLMTEIVTTDEEGEPMEPFMLTTSFLPMDKEVAGESKLLQVTADVPVEIGGMTRLDVLELMQYMTFNAPTASVVLTRKVGQEGDKLTVRMVHAQALEEEIDFEVFGNLIDMFMQTFNVAEYLAQLVAGGKTLEEAIALV